MGVRNASESKTDLQGHPRSLVLVPFDRPLMISNESSILTTSLSCTVSKTLTVNSQNLKRSRDPEHIYRLASMTIIRKVFIELHFQRHSQTTFSFLMVVIPNSS